MARIRPPAPFNELITKLSPSMDTLWPLMQKYKATDATGAYLPWDKFKWKVDKGDNEQVAWVATKLARKATAKYISELIGQNATEHFNYSVQDSLHAKLHYIDKITGGGQVLGDAAFITKHEKDKYLVKSLMMEEAITSSQLEGAATTRKVAKEMLESNRPPKDKSEQMIVNNYLLMKKVFEKKNEDLSVNLLLDLHRIATYQAIDNNAISGELRTANDISVKNSYNEIAHEPPCFTTLKERLIKLCEFANKNSDGQQSDHFVHPLVKAIILHFMIGYIHPFGDGNGRTARALFYWSMLRSGYWLFEFVSISKLIQEKRSDYDAAFIYTETDELDLTYFLYNQVDTVVQAVDALQLHIKNQKQELYQLKSWIEHNPLAKKLKTMQLEILKAAVKEPGKIFTSKQVATLFNVTENTARSHLNALVEANLLVVAKANVGKSILYVAPANLQAKINGF